MEIIEKETLRYPGSRSFSDTKIDRLLFFGREKEIQSLLHLILSERIIVLFAKSGMGKTSLLNAGIFEPLRERKYFPIQIRINDISDDKEILDNVYQEIENNVERYNVEHTIRDKSDFRQYMKTSEFWSKDDDLLIPILVFDQFEELFTLHSEDKRKRFITQLANLSKKITSANILQNESENNYDKDNSLDIKIIISIREDFLAFLEELATEIPAILFNRFRLKALSPEQAKLAIVEPARIDNNELVSYRFSYSPKAVQTIIKFLGEYKDKNSNNIKTDKIEPFQLQLICQDIENNILPKLIKKETEKGVVISENDLGGDTGMKTILRKFYKKQLHRVKVNKRKKIRKLCEKGLIISGRRLSLDGEAIKKKYKIKEKLLSDLVAYRLLRKEPRMRGYYYEISHDTLIDPILYYRIKRRKIIRRTSFSCIFFLIISICIIYIRPSVYPISADEFFQKAEKYDLNGKDYKAEQYYQKCIKKDKTKLKAYDGLADVYVSLKNMKKAFEIYDNGIQNNSDNPDNYYNLVHNMARFCSNNKEYLLKKDRNIETKSRKEVREKKTPETQSITGSIPGQQTQTFDTVTKDYIRVSESIYENINSVVSYIDSNNVNEAIKLYRKITKEIPEQGYVYRIINNMIYGDGYERDSIYNIAFNNKIQNASYFYCLGRDLYNNLIDSLALLSFERSLNIDSTNAVVYNKIGAIFESQKKYEKAIEIYQNAEKFDSKNPDLFHKIAYDFEILDKYEKAIEYYKKSVKLDSTNIYRLLKVAILLEKQKKKQEADIYFNKAAKIYPDYYIECNTLGNVYFDNGNYEESEKYYQKAIELDPGYVYPYYNLGLIFEKQDKYEKALEFYQNAIKADPTYINAYYNIGAIFEDQKKYEKAIEIYLNAEKFDSKNPDLFHKIAYDYGILEKYDKAIEYYKKVIVLNPGNVYALNNIGVAFYNQEEYEKAEKYYKKAITLDPGYVYAYNNLGLILQNNNKYEEAIKYYEKAIELDPGYVYAFYNLGNTFYNQAEYKKAEKYYKKAIELDPSYVNALNGLGSTFYIQEKYDKAEKYYKKAIELDSGYVYAFYNLGNAFYNQAEYKEAEKYYKKAIELNPKYVDALNSLGNAFYNQEEYEKAEKYYKKVIELNPDNVVALNSLGVALVLSGNKNKFNEAFIYINKAILLDSTYISAYMNLTELQIMISDYEGALKTVQKAKPFTKLTEDNAFLYFYECIAKKILDLDISVCEENFNKIMTEEFPIYGIFDTFDNWVNESNLPSEKKEYIIEKTDQLKEHLKND